MPGNYIKRIFQHTAAPQTEDYTTSLSIPTGTNRVAILALTGGKDDTYQNASPKLGGVSFTERVGGQAGNNSTDPRASIWTIYEASLGSGTLTFTIDRVDAFKKMSLALWIFEYVDQTTPILDTKSESLNPGTVFSETLTVDRGSVCIMCVHSKATSVTSDGDGQVPVINGLNDGNIRYISYEMPILSGGTETQTATVDTNTQGGGAYMSLNPAYEFYNAGASPIFFE